jgi:WS/DGAT/MGAT family acyltransferase
VKRLAGIDAAFLYLETPSMHSHVVGTIVLDPATSPEPFDLDRLKRLLEARLHLLAPFRRRLAWVPFNLSHPVWIEDPDFDLDDHVHHTTLPEPGGVEQLATLVGEIASRPIDRRRPLWELWYVDGLHADAGGEGGGDLVALVTKIHHAAIDGVTGADLMAQLFDLEATTPLEPDTPSTWEPDPIPNPLVLATDALTHLLTNPVKLVRALARTIQGVADAVQEVRTPSSDHPSPALPLTAPRVRWTASITPSRTVAFSRAALDDLRAVKAHFGVTVNDVVLAACTLAIRSYLLAHDDLPDDPLICSVPVSVRGQSDIEASNQVSAMFVRLPVQLDDPAEVLATIHGETRAAKVMQSAIGAKTLQELAQFIPGAAFNQAARLYSSLNLADRHKPIHNVIISNVPGPPIPLYAAGAQVRSVVPLGPLMEGAGLNITVLSNMGNVDFGVVGCTELVPDVWDLATAFPEGVAALRALVDDERPAESSA